MSKYRMQAMQCPKCNSTIEFHCGNCKAKLAERGFFVHVTGKDSHGRDACILECAICSNKMDRLTCSCGCVLFAQYFLKKLAWYE